MNIFTIIIIKSSTDSNENSSRVLFFFVFHWNLFFLTVHIVYDLPLFSTTIYLWVADYFDWISNKQKTKINLFIFFLFFSHFYRTRIFFPLCVCIGGHFIHFIHSSIHQGPKVKCSPDNKQCVCVFSGGM